jgi:uncharacterized membrane protein
MVRRFKKKTQLKRSGTEVFKMIMERGGYNYQTDKGF